MFLALTETHLNTTIMDAEIHFAGYTIYRADREHRSHGGVAIYLKDSLAATTRLLLSYSNGTCEILAVHVEGIDLVITVVYRPPDCTWLQWHDILEKMEEILGGLSDPAPDVLIMGDFNFPHVSWPDGKCSGGTWDEQKQALCLQQLMNRYFIIQFATTLYYSK